jgi:glycosyltransferase involved in cell wall biosynthesis
LSASSHPFFPTGIIAYALDRGGSGISRYTLQLIASLRRIGFPLTVFEAGNYFSDPAVVRLPGASRLPLLLTLGQLEIAWAARRQKLDLVHDPTGVCPLFLTAARRVVTIHDVFPYVSPHTSTTLDRLIYRLWLPLAVRRVDAVITDSQNSKNDILRFLPVKAGQITVIPVAASPNYRPLAAGQVLPVLERHRLPQPYILYVGSIEPRKNLLRLLQAYALLRESLPGWRLVIVGARNVWLSSSLTEEIERLNLKTWIHFTGYVPEEDLPALYNGAGLFVFPSLYEGFGLPVLEAMACGVPVITSQASSLPEVAGDAALLVDPHSVEEIAAAMLRVLSDPGLRQDLKFRGLERSAGFSWERTARQTIDVYQKVLGEA